MFGENVPIAVDRGWAFLDIRKVNMLDEIDQALRCTYLTVRTVDRIKKLLRQGLHGALGFLPLVYWSEPLPNGAFHLPTVLGHRLPVSEIPSVALLLDSSVLHCRLPSVP